MEGKSRTPLKAKHGAEKKEDRPKRDGKDGKGVPSASKGRTLPKGKSNSKTRQGAKHGSSAYTKSTDEVRNNWNVPWRDTWSQLAENRASSKDFFANKTKLTKKFADIVAAPPPSAFDNKCNVLHKALDELMVLLKPFSPKRQKEIIILFGGNFDRVPKFANDQRILFILDLFKRSNKSKFYIPNVSTLELDESTIDSFFSDIEGYRKLLCYSIYYDCYYSKLKGAIEKLKQTFKSIPAFTVSQNAQYYLAAFSSILSDLRSHNADACPAKNFVFLQVLDLINFCSSMVVRNFESIHTSNELTPIIKNVQNPLVAIFDEIVKLFGALSIANDETVHLFMINFNDNVVNKETTSASKASTNSSVIPSIPPPVIPQVETPMDIAVNHHTESVMTMEMLSYLIDKSAAEASVPDNVENVDFSANLVPNSNRDDLFENTLTNTIDLTHSPLLSPPPMESLQNLPDFNEDQRLIQKRSYHSSSSSICGNLSNPNIAVEPIARNKIGIVDPITGETNPSNACIRRKIQDAQFLANI